LIEQWRNEARKQTLYRLKAADLTAPPADPQTRGAAETHFLREIMPGNVGTTTRSVLPLSMALNLDDRPLRQSVRETWQRETRAPRSLLFALRAALRHKRLYLFRMGKPWEHVSGICPATLDATHAVAPIREVIGHLREHPGTRREALLTALRPGQAADAPSCAELLSHVAWLVEKGHIIELHDGALAAADAAVVLSEERKVAPRSETAESPQQPAPEA
jgi:hypothetical protein